MTSAMSIRDLARAERRAAKRARRELEEALAALPAPQFEYELEAPAVNADENDEGRVETVVEEDMADVDAEERRRLHAETEKLYEARSSVVKRSDLPRPVGAIPDDEVTSIDDTEEGVGNAAEVLINEERFTLLKHDAFAFPVEATTSLLGDKKGKKKKKKQKSPSTVPEERTLEHIPEKALDNAKEFIKDQCDRDLQDLVQSLLQSGKTTNQAKSFIMHEMLNSAKTSSYAKEIFVTNAWKDPKDDNQVLAKSLAQEFDTIEEATSALHKRNEKLESKLALLTGGFAKRAKNTSTGILKVYHGLQNACIETSVFKRLSEQEELGAVSRIDRLRSAIVGLNEDERRLRDVYNSLLAADGADE